jgi:hypothetical protein
MRDHIKKHCGDKTGKGNRRNVHSNCILLGIIVVLVFAILPLRVQPLLPVKRGAKVQPPPTSCEHIRLEAACIDPPADL